MKRTLQSVFCSGFVLISFSLFSQHVVINEIYGGGGNSGSTYKNDFIELYNPTSSSVSLNGWSVQYVSATGNGNWSVTTLSGSIAAGGYYLIQEGAGGAGTVNLLTPDANGSINMAAGAGKIALVSSTIPLVGCTLVGVIDLVGYGSTANCFETSFAPAPSATVSIERKIVGVDSDHNSSDFQTASPNPRNKIIEFTSGYPKIQNITGSDFNVVTNLSKTGIAYVVVLSSGATAPNALQVKNGQDGSGVSVNPNLKATVNISSTNTDLITNISGVSELTAYDIYIIAENSGFLQSNPVKITATTISLTPPTIIPSVGSITFPGYTDKTKLSASQIYNLVTSDLSNDIAVEVSGNFLISKNDINYTSSISFSVSDFAGTTTYPVYVKFNPDGNTGSQTGTITHTSQDASDKLITLSAIGIDPYNQNFNHPDFLLNSGWTQYSKTGAQVWASTNFGHTCLSGCTNTTVDKAAQINGFSGSARDNDDWLISPALDLASFNNFASLSFWSISAFAGDQLRLKYSTNYVESQDPSLSTWTDIDGKFPKSNSGIWKQSANIILPNQNNLRVAFVYTSNTTAASRWTIDDWQIQEINNYLDAPDFSFSFDEVDIGNNSASQNFIFKAAGYGAITLTPAEGYEVSVDNSAFSKTLVIPEAEASAGKLIYVRFTPFEKRIQWSGGIAFTGTGLNATVKGSLSGSSLFKSETFDITTYNLEFFGSDVKDEDGNEFGPTNDALQIINVGNVMNAIGSDIFALEEIANDNAFNQLVAGLPGYDKIVSDKWSYSFDEPDPNFPPQKIGFIYKTTTVELISSRVMFEQMYNDIRAGALTLPNYPGGLGSSFWSSGRLPFMATFDVTINGAKKRLRVVVIHAKSGSAQADYNRRKYDVNVLRDSLNTYDANDNVILLGDFNDDVDNSILNGSESSYKSFVDDTHFKPLTYQLSQGGASSFPSSGSFLDHIIISDELNESYLENSVKVEDMRNHIANYATTTSDHLPVSARFMFKADQTITFENLSPKRFGDDAFNLVASSSADLSIIFKSSNPTILSIDGTIATILKPGRVDIIASQSGNELTNPAEEVTQQLIIGKRIQTISFDPLLDKTVEDVPFELMAMSSSGLTTTFRSSNPTILSIDGSLATIHKSGVVEITATQPGNETVDAANNVVRSLVVNKLDQSISLGELANKAFGEAFDLIASSTSLLPVEFESSDPSILSIDGARVTINKPGSVDIIASQEGNVKFNSAVKVIRSLVINKATQSISFGKVTDQNVEDESLFLKAISSSGLPVSFTTTSENIIIEDDVVRFLKSGRVTVSASQTGNEFYEAASSVNQSFCINPKKPVISSADSGLFILTSNVPGGNQWYINGLVIEEAISQTLTATLSGTYTVQIKADDCVSELSNSFTLLVTGDIISQTMISVYPNPVTDHLIISGVDLESQQCAIIDMTGRRTQIKLEDFKESYSADVSQLNPGIYLLILNAKSGVSRLRFVKNE